MVFRWGVYMEEVVLIMVVFCGLVVDGGYFRWCRYW